MGDPSGLATSASEVNIPAAVKELADEVGKLIKTLQENNFSFGVEGMGDKDWGGKVKEFAFHLVKIEQWLRGDLKKTLDSNSPPPEGGGQKSSTGEETATEEDIPENYRPANVDKPTGDLLSQILRQTENVTKLYVECSAKKKPKKFFEHLEKGNFDLCRPADTELVDQDSLFSDLKGADTNPTSYDWTLVRGQIFKTSKRWHRLLHAKREGVELQWRPLPIADAVYSKEIIEELKAGANEMRKLRAANKKSEA